MTLTQENKRLLLMDLSSRLPYGVKVCFKYDVLMGETTEELTPSLIEKFNNLSGELYQLKPFLRPLSSMTEEERKELRNILCWNFAPEDCPIFENDFSVTTFHSYNEREQNEYYDMSTMLTYFNFLNTNHFDYRNLIPMGLALPATEGMYNLKK